MFSGILYFQVIDKDELDGVLDTTLGLLLSKSAVENIITSIDKDSNGTLDFFEVLQVKYLCLVL